MTTLFAHFALIFLFRSNPFLPSPISSLPPPLEFLILPTTNSSMAPGEESAIDCLPVDLLAYIFSSIASFKDLAQASKVCRKWRQGVEESLARRESLSFSGWKMDDESTTRLVNLSYGLKELDISRSRWGCQITDHGLHQLSKAKCISNLSSVSLWGATAITDKGVIQFISCANSLQHLNIGGTFITDASLFVVAESCPHLKTLVLWGCRQVTESGLLIVVNKCLKLESINVWGMRVPLDCFIGLHTIRPSLQIRPEGVLLNDNRYRMLPIH